MVQKLSERDREILRVEHQKGIIENGVNFFSREMKDELLKHLDRPGWKRESNEYLFDRLLDEVLELKEILKIKLRSIKDSGEYFETKKQIIKECADVANFAMMIAHNNF